MPFTPFKVLPACPNDSVNCVTFSSDTEYLASGGDDGNVYIYAFKSPAAHPLKAEYPTAVTSLRWVPGSYRLFVGLASGSLHLLTGIGRLFDVRVAHVSSQDVSSIALDWRHRRLAIASGTTVYVFDVSRMDEGICKHLLVIRGGPCNRLEAVSKRDDPWEIQDVFFIDRGSRCLVAYLSFGIRIINMETMREEEMKCLSKTGDVGVCAIDETETYIAVFNIRNGFDFYDIRQDTYLGTVQLEMREAVALPACFLSGYRQVVLGASNGQVKVVTLPGLREVDVLDHGEDIIQALSHCPASDSVGFIATGCSEKGTETYVKVWKFHPHRLAIERVIDGFDYLRSMSLTLFLRSDCSFECAQQHQNSFVLVLFVLLLVWMIGLDYWVGFWRIAEVEVQVIVNWCWDLTGKVYVQCASSLAVWWGSAAFYLDMITKMLQDWLSVYL